MYKSQRVMFSVNRCIGLNQNEVGLRLLNVVLNRANILSQIRIILVLIGTRTNIINNSVNNMVHRLHKKSH